VWAGRECWESGYSQAAMASTNWPGPGPYHVYEDLLDLLHVGVVSGGDVNGLVASPPSAHY
jgi:hypothetical protein